jgi:hypothetical protein
MDQDDPKSSKSKLDRSHDPIWVLWQCGMEEACTNLKRPGLHADYNDCGICRGLPSEKAFDFAALVWKAEAEEPQKPAENSLDLP